MRPAFAVYLLTISLAASVCAQSISDLEAAGELELAALELSALLGIPEAQVGAQARMGDALIPSD